MASLSAGAIRTIDLILSTALAEGRSALFEHEVYGIVSSVGLQAPRFHFVRDSSEVTAETLRGFGHTIIAKIVSSGIAHKQKLGGVKKISSADPLYAQFVLERMRKEVLGHFPSECAPEIEGFLLVEYIPHTQALGYESLLGFREDLAFGPVLTLSKGGDDAEFFAANYDPPNLLLPPMEYEEALAFAQSLHIKRKFDEIGRPEYIEMMARALAAFSLIARHYSPLGDSPCYVISELEVNPFAISKDGRFVALDGVAQFAPVERATAWEARSRLENLEFFFKPKGIAVVGASADMSRYSLGRDIAELLHDLRGGTSRGARGGASGNDLFLVNPHVGSVRFGSAEYPLYRDLSEVPAGVELAVYAAPARNAPGFLRSLSASSVKAVILIPGVPTSMSYPDFERQLREATPEGIRVIGPNCMGVYYAPRPCEGAKAAGLNTLFINEKRLEVRSSENANAVLLTQSGALAVTALDKLRNCKPFRSVVSFGNKYDVKASDLLAYFVREPEVGVIALYLEGLDAGEGRQLFEIARGAAKPIIAYKGGRTEAGARSAASHTAALSGNYEVFRAACRQTGMILAETIEEYYDLIRAFSLLAAKPPAGNRVAGVVNAGFESTVGADELRGLTQARLGPETVRRLNEINRFGLVDTSLPFLDVTPMADDELYASFVEAVIADDGVDCVFVAVVPHAVTLKTTPDTCRDPRGLANLLVGIARRSAKPMVISVNAGRYYADFVAALEEGGLPVYADITSAITSLDTFVSHCLRRGGNR